MIKTNFIYFPSFSAGEMGSNFVKDHRFRNDMTIRFYSEEYPKEYQHNQILITAGAHMSVKDYKNKTYTPVELNYSLGTTYDRLQFDYKTNDKKFIISSLHGTLITKELEECNKIRDKIFIW